MTRRFAQDTSVSVEKSKVEIEKLLTRYGATAFVSGWQERQAVIQFEMNNRRVRFVLPLPAKEEFTRSPGRSLQRSAEAIQSAWEQACRQSWRALALVVKAKLEAVAAKITTFDSEFLAHVVMPDGKTVAEHVIPKVQIAYQSGDMPPMLPDYSRKN